MGVKDQKMCLNFNRRGFTLLELLTVISIIVILAGFVMPALNRARQKAFQTKVKAQIAGLELALSMYESDVGRFPDTDFTTQNPDSGYGNVLVTWFVNDGKANPAGWEGPYMDFKDNEVDGDYVVDAWNQPFKYMQASPQRPDSFGLYSVGCNGVDEAGEGDELVNWK